MDRHTKRRAEQRRTENVSWRKYSNRTTVGDRLLVVNSRLRSLSHHGRGCNEKYHRHVSLRYGVIRRFPVTYRTDHRRRGVFVASIPAKTAATITITISSFIPRCAARNGSTIKPFAISRNPPNIPNTAKQRSNVDAHCRSGSHGYQRCRMRSGWLNVVRAKTITYRPTAEEKMS